MIDSDQMYHVVCRDCTTESLTASRADAETRAASHASAAGHDVEFAPV